MWELFGLFFNKSDFLITGLQIGLFGYNTYTSHKKHQFNPKKYITSQSGNNPSKTYRTSVCRY